MTQNHLTVQYEVLTDSGETVKDTSGSSDTGPRDCTLWGTDRLWTGCTRPQWTQWHRTHRWYIMKYWQTVDRHYKTPVNAETQIQQTVHYELLTDFGQTLQDTRGAVTQNQKAVPYELLTDSRQYIQATSGHIDTEPTDSTMLSSDRLYKTTVDWTKISLF